MADLSVEEIITIHNKICKLFGIPHGIINKGNLAAVVERPNTIINGKEIFPDVHSKAASLLEGIIRWHPFADGNKRTALLTMTYYLKLEGYGFALPLSAVRYTVKIAKNQYTDEKHTKKLLKEITQWIQNHSGRTKKELRGKLVVYLIIPYRFLGFLVRIKLERFATRIVSKWMAFDMYPEYKKTADEIMDFINETLTASLKVFDWDDPKQK